MDILHYFLAVFFSVMFLIYLKERKREREAWNKGTCTKCYTAWRQFDTDSQGGRGYKCENDHYMWVGIGYPDKCKSTGPR